MKLLNKTYPSPLIPHETWEVTDSTKLQCYKDCPRMYFYQYVLGWRRSTPNNHLQYGKAIHIAMEHLLLNGYDNDSLLEAFSLFNQEYRKVFGEETDDLFTPKTPDRTIQMLAEYCNLYKDDFNKYEVVMLDSNPMIEISGIVSVDGYYNLYFKMDSILRRLKDGKIFSLEHKTKGGPFNRQWRMDFPLGTQVGTYTHALYCLFDPAEVLGVTINGLALKKTKTPMFEFERLPIWKTPSQMQTWQCHTVRWLAQLEYDFNQLVQAQEGDDVLVAFPMNERSCTKYFGCPYHDFCLAWPNPLQRAWEPPIGFDVDFWDPRAEDKPGRTFNLGGPDEN